MPLDPWRVGPYGPWNVSQRPIILIGSDTYFRTNWKSCIIYCNNEFFMFVFQINNDFELNLSHLFMWHSKDTAIMMLHLWGLVKHHGKVSSNMYLLSWWCQYWHGTLIFHFSHVNNPNNPQILNAHFSKSQLTLDLVKLRPLSDIKLVIETPETHNFPAERIVEYHLWWKTGL